MSRNSLLPSSFEKELKKFYFQHKNQILDFILFGSTVRGKEYPGDVDLLVLVKDKVTLDFGYLIRKLAQKYNLELQLIVKTYDELLASDFLARESFLSEGYSLIKKDFISHLLHYSSFCLFKYDLKNLNKTQRMLFYYSLNGRKEGDEGMLKKLNAVKFSDTILFVPLFKIDETKEYLHYWNIGFFEMPVLIPERMTKSQKFKN